MSKSLGNYPPVDTIFEQFGSDALRLYLINTPVVRAGDIKFQEDQIRLIVQKYHRMVTNAVTFYLQMVDLFDKRAKPEIFKLFPLNIVKKFRPELFTSLDHWILQCLNDLITSVHRDMDRYELHGLVAKFLKFIDQLSRGYMNLNKSRFKSHDGFNRDPLVPLSILGNCLYYFALITAPFAPFLSEIIYQQVKRTMIWDHNDKGKMGWGQVIEDSASSQTGSRRQSIHFQLIPEGNVWDSDGSLLQLFEYFSDITDLLRGVRAQRTREVDGKEVPASSIKLAFSKMTVVHQDPTVLEQLRDLEDTIKDEMNIVELAFDTDLAKYVSFSASLDIAKTKERIQDGKQLGKVIRFAKKDLTEAQARAIALGDKTPVPVDIPSSSGGGLVIMAEELTVKQTPKVNGVYCTDQITIVIEDQITPEILEKYYYKLFYRGYQEARKEMGYQQTDDVQVSCCCSAKVRKLLEKFNSKESDENQVEHLTFETDSNKFLSSGLIHKVRIEMGLVLIVLH